MRVRLKGVQQLSTWARPIIMLGAVVRGFEANPGRLNSTSPINEAVEERRTPDTGRFKSLVVAYRASPDYAKLADSTKRIWSRWLDRIARSFWRASHCSI